MIRNLAEDHVHASYESLRSRFPDFCGCDVCRDDVLVYTLNRVPARYVSRLQGSVLTEVSLEKDQIRAAIDVAMMEALRKISMAPRCGRRRASGPRKPGGAAVRLRPPLLFTLCYGAGLATGLWRFGNPILALPVLGAAGLSGGPLVVLAGRRGGAGPGER